MDHIHCKKIENEVKPTEITRINNTIVNVSSTWYNMIESFLRIADKNRQIISIESIKQYMSEFTGLKNVGKFASQI